MLPKCMQTPMYIRVFKQFIMVVRQLISMTSCPQHFKVVMVRRNNMMQTMIILLLTALFIE